MSIGEDYFDVYNIFVNEIIGSVIIALFIVIIIINIAAIKAKTPFGLIGLFNILVLIFFFSVAFLQIIWVFVVLIAGMVFYYNMSKAIGGN